MGESTYIIIVYQARPSSLCTHRERGSSKGHVNEVSTDQSDSTIQILGSNLCVGGSLRVTVIAYLLLMKEWQQIKLEGDVDKVLDNDLAMLGHSTVIKNRERLYKAS